MHVYLYVQVHTNEPLHTHKLYTHITSHPHTHTVTINNNRKALGQGCIGSSCVVLLGRTRPPWRIPVTTKKTFMIFGMLSENCEVILSCPN